MSKTIKLDPLNPRKDLIIKAAGRIKAGGVVAFPTKYLYGLGVDAFNGEAVGKVFEIKRRPYHKPLLVLIHKQDDLNALVNKVPLAAERIMKNFWPGAITIVLESKDTLPANLTAGTRRIGVRMPEHPVAVALTRAVAGPITATSANITGDPGCSQILDMDPLIIEKLDFILDVGPLKGGIGSTV
ncbi:MAG: threonylcarbamoyl-AMP synthase, partial [Desulfobacterales bacterium]